MPLIPVDSITRDGIRKSLVPVSPGGDEFHNRGTTFFLIENGDRDMAVTIHFPSQIEGIEVKDVTVDVLGGTSKLVGPFPSVLFNNSPLDTVRLSYSNTTRVIIQVLRLAS